MSSTDGSADDGSTTDTREDRVAESSEQSAEEFNAQRFEWLSNGQMGPMYDTLYPAQRSMLDETTFEECMSQQMTGIDITVDKVVDTYTETTTVPGTGESVESVAFTVELTMSQGGAEFSDTDTVHVLEMPNGSWAWALDGSTFNKIQAGNCA